MLFKIAPYPFVYVFADNPTLVEGIQPNLFTTPKTISVSSFNLIYVLIKYLFM